MKALWLCNGVLKRISEPLGLKENPFSGWLDGAAEGLLAGGDFALAVVFPYPETLRGTAGGVEHYTFDERNIKGMPAAFRLILREAKPDVVHIFGTEFYQSKAMAAACREEKIPFAVGIQGLTGECARHYFAALPQKIVKRYTFRDFIRRDNIYRQAKKFAKKGEWEADTLRMAEHVIGRTDWDRACVYAANRNARYHFCNETLRPAFYKRKWDINACERNSVFISQSGYPIKGFHLFLEAAGLLKREYPDLKIYTTGEDVLHPDLLQKLRRGSYRKYIAELLRKYGLEKNIAFTGRLGEEAMCRQYLKAHVFVSPSSIENSPNSVGEAMLLGVPTVSSDVGGVKNLLTHGEEGLVYPYDEPKVLAYYIKRIFDDDDLARRFSENARKRAADIYDSEKNAQRLKEIYRAVQGEQKSE